MRRRVKGEENIFQENKKKKKRNAPRMAAIK